MYIKISSGTCQIRQYITIVILSMKICNHHNACKTAIEYCLPRKGIVIAAFSRCSPRGGLRLFKYGVMFKGWLPYFKNFPLKCSKCMNKQNDVIHVQPKLLFHLLLQNVTKAMVYNRESHKSGPPVNSLSDRADTNTRYLTAVCQIEVKEGISIMRIIPRFPSIMLSLYYGVAKDIYASTKGVEKTRTLKLQYFFSCCLQ